MSRHIDGLAIGTTIALKHHEQVERPRHDDSFCIGNVSGTRCDRDGGGPAQGNATTAAPWFWVAVLLRLLCSDSRRRCLKHFWYQLML